MKSIEHINNTLQMELAVSLTPHIYHNWNFTWTFADFCECILWWRHTDVRACMYVSVCLSAPSFQPTRHIIYTIHLQIRCDSSHSTWITGTCEAVQKFASEFHGRSHCWSLHIFLDEIKLWGDSNYAHISTWYLLQRSNAVYRIRNKAILEASSHCFMKPQISVCTQDSGLNPSRDERFFLKIH